MTPLSETMDPPVETPASTMHALTVLETKLYKPKWRAGHVSRARLIERMHQGAQGQLTLVSAPRGLWQDDAAGGMARPASGG